MQPLYDLNRHPEAAEVYEATLAEGAEPTDAVLLAAGGTYIAMRRPTPAIDPYQHMVDRRDRLEPEVRPADVYKAEQGLFWAYLESEQLQRARKQAWDVNAEMVDPPVGRLQAPDNLDLAIREA